MLQIEKLSFRYPKSKKTLFDDFTLALEKGKIYGLLGKNGVGKSTLLYLMTGLLTPGKGEVLYCGVNVRKRFPITLENMFLVPEEFELPPISLNDYVNLNARFYPKFSKEDMKKYLAFFEMDTPINLGALSMGQKKKVFMSFALATNTSLLIMDEPTNGLDIPGKSQFRKIMASGMTENKTIVISTHQVRDVDKLLDHILIMDYSKVLLNKSTTDISKNLLFKESESNRMLEEALFSTPSIQGYSMILPNDGGRESDINLELLFNAILTVPERINQVLNEKTTLL